MAKMNLEELRNFRESKKEELKKTEITNKTYISIGMGTCGIAAGAIEAENAFLSEIKEQNIEDTVVIRKTGCMGFCHSEPTVEVSVRGMPSFIYSKVDAETAKMIVRKHIIGRDLVDGHIIDRPAVDIITVDDGRK